MSDKATEMVIHFSSRGTNFVKSPEKISEVRKSIRLNAADYELHGILTGYHHPEQATNPKITSPPTIIHCKNWDFSVV